MDGANMSPMSESRRLDVIDSKIDKQGETLNEIKVQLATMQTSNQLRISNLEKAHDLMSNRLSGLVLGFIGAIITGVGTWFSQNLLNR